MKNAVDAGVALKTAPRLDTPGRRDVNVEAVPSWLVDVRVTVAGPSAKVSVEPSVRTYAKDEGAGVEVAASAVEPESVAVPVGTELNVLVATLPSSNSVT